MKNVIATAFIASSLLAGPGILLTTTSASAQTACGPDVPASWFEPGGFCAQSAGTSSLTLPGTDSGEPCTPVLVELLSAVQVLPVGERIQVAVACEYEIPDYVPPSTDD